MSFDVINCRKDFPILDQQINNYPLAYLDNAATTQKPKVVIDAIKNYYNFNNSNVHRAVHTLAERSTLAYEDSRKTIAKFINAPKPENCIFTKGTTDAINTVASGFSRAFIREGDEIIITQMEHHSNIVPWHMCAEHCKANVKYIPIKANGELDLDSLPKLITNKTKLIAAVHVSNTLGTINPVEDIISEAKKHSVPVLIDGAQAAANLNVDVSKLDCDFYTFSAHKLYGPTGVGVLYMKDKWLDSLPPYQGGGDMISTVSMEKSTYAKAPQKFEAGTPNIADNIAFAKAIEYVEKAKNDNFFAYKSKLHDYLEDSLLSLPDVKMIGTAKNKVALSTFTFSNIHPHDLGTICNNYGVAIRAGHHCTMPLMEYYKVPATVRASLAMYSTKEEVDQLIHSLKEAKKLFKR